MSDEDKNTLDTDYEEVDNVIYLSAPQLALKIKDTDIRVRHWADEFGDLIGIEKINGRKRYKESDIYKFAFIKDLIDNKNFKHDQVRIYLEKHGFKYEKYDSGLVNPKDPLGFEALASAINTEVTLTLEQFKTSLSEDFRKTMRDFLESQYQLNLETKAEIESSVDNIIGEKIGEIEKSNTKLHEELTLTVEDTVTKKLNEQQKKYEEKIDELEKKATERDLKLIEPLKAVLEERQKKEKEQHEKKGFWNKWFGK